jgi:hypothetical protein
MFIHGPREAKAGKARSLAADDDRADTVTSNDKLQKGETVHHESPRFPDRDGPGAATAKYRSPSQVTQAGELPVLREYKH